MLIQRILYVKQIFLTAFNSSNTCERDHPSQYGAEQVHQSVYQIEKKWLTVQYRRALDVCICATATVHRPRQPAIKKKSSFQNFSQKWNFPENRATYVNMKPASMSLANIGNLIQWIKCTEYSCASCGADKERDLTPGLSFDNGTFKFAGNQASGLIRMDHYAIVCAQAAHRCTRLHRIMALIGGEHHQFTGQALRSVLFVIGEHPMTGRQKCVQIWNRTARCQNRIATIPADDFAHFRQHNRFH